MASVQQFGEFVLSALDVVEFKLIRCSQDLENDQIAFNPSMAHQIFGDSENIFGYQNLKVRVNYIADALHINLCIKYDKRVEHIYKDTVVADDITSILKSKLPEGCTFLDIDEFLKLLEKSQKFLPFGEKLTEHIVQLENGQERIFEFYHCNIENAAFRNYFQRFETLVLWFVDGACYIDVDDPQWTYFICYERYRDVNGDVRYATVGYTTVYQYYAYPQNMRPRISQMMILPPFQQLGIGSNFLECIYLYYRGDKTVIDITVEDPSENFQRMRNFVDARLCLALKAFSREEICKGFTKEMVNEAREKLKINPYQCRKVYEILRLFYTNRSDIEDYKSYRLDVKRRLNSVYYKKMKDVKKMENANIDTKWVYKVLPSASERIEQLNQEYSSVEREYIPIVDKLRDH